jgi:hypothetical protein
VAALLLLTIVVTPLALHFAQKSHDRLPFDVDAAFPADRTLVGGEAFASTVVALMRRELSGGTG